MKINKNNMALRLIAFLVILSSACSINAQEFDYRLGKVTKAQLKEKKHPVDEDADAAILFSKGETFITYTPDDGFNMITEVDIKIKIYSKDGYEWANKTIPYYDPGTNGESIRVSKAATYNLENGKIRKVKLKNEGEFTEEVNKFWKLKKIVMPEVKEGSIIEYRYTIKSPDITSIREWRFQETIPVNHSYYTTHIPEYFIFIPNFRGFHIPKTDKKIVNQSITSGKNQTDKLEFQETISNYELSNLPAMEDQAFINTIDNYIASIEHEITQISFPNSPIKQFATSWDAVTETIYKSDNFGTELNKTGYYEEDINALLTGLSTDEEKTSAIFNYVKNRMNWNEYFGYYCIDGVRSAYKNKVGNIGEINLMLTSMLRYAGLKANPVLVTTRSSKVALSPNRKAFNYVVTAIEKPEGMLLLDATSKNAVPGILPLRALNWTGRLVKENGTSQAISMVPAAPSLSTVSLMAEMDEEGKLTGQVKEEYYSYSAQRFRNSSGEMSSDTNIERLEKKYAGIIIDEYEVINQNELNEAVAEKYTFAHDGAVDIIADKIYMNPMLFFAVDENPFKKDKREYPIDFVYPVQSRYMMSITLPEGYKVESVPESATITMEDDIAAFSYNVIASGNRINFRGAFVINTAVVPQDYYLKIKDFFQQLIDKENEKVVIARN